MNFQIAVASWPILRAVFHTLSRMCASTHRPTDAAVASSLSVSLVRLQLLQASCRQRSMAHRQPGASISINGVLSEWRDAFVPAWTQELSNGNSHRYLYATLRRVC